MVSRDQLRDQLKSFGSSSNTPHPWRSYWPSGTQTRCDFCGVPKYRHGKVEGQVPDLDEVQCTDTECPMYDNYQAVEHTLDDHVRKVKGWR